MVDVAVFSATAAAIFGAPTLALLFTVRESDDARAAFSPTGAAENEPPVSSKSTAENQDVMPKRLGPGHWLLRENSPDRGVGPTGKGSAGYTLRVARVPRAGLPGDLRKRGRGCENGA
jgi:hypothetical protein